MYSHCVSVNIRCHERDRKTCAKYEYCGISHREIVFTYIQTFNISSSLSYWNDHFDSWRVNNIAICSTLSNNNPKHQASE